jgi:urease accessory protein
MSAAARPYRAWDTLACCERISLDNRFHGHHHHEPLALERDRRIPRVGIGGPVGSGKTALIEALVPLLIADGYPPLVITNDIVTREDAEHVRRTLAGTLDPQRVLGVETGACPHTAVRDDPTLNLAAAAELEARYGDGRVLLLESGGDNLTLTFSRALVDFFIFVIDVAGGDKIPRKRGPGLIQADLLVINKVDLAPYVGASLEVMEHDSRLVRGGRPFVFTNCRTGEGVRAVLETIERTLLENEKLKIEN